MNSRRITALLCAAVLALSACAAGAEAPKHPYGVFLSVTENLEQFADYETVVIDAQYYPKEEIDAFRSEGHQVFTYLNVGSLEDFREYYEAYKDLSLGTYEHWEEEVWVDVSSPRWQDLVLKTLAPALLEKDVDGFFVDNCDVYWVHPEEKILEGLGVIMKGLMQTGKKVIVNGGDTFLDAWCERKGAWDEVITGINPYAVFCAILWDENAFGTAEDEDREYFTDYVNRYGSQGADIYLLEYTADPDLIRTIDAFCSEHGYLYYVSDSVELDGTGAEAAGPAFENEDLMLEITDFLASVWDNGEPDRETKEAIIAKLTEEHPEAADMIRQIVESYRSSYN